MLCVKCLDVCEGARLGDELSIRMVTRRQPANVPPSLNFAIAAFKVGQNYGPISAEIPSLAR